MYKKSKVITFSDWRGVNNTQDASLIADNELQECVNFYVSNTGRLIARPGLTKIADTPAPVKDITKFNGELYIACDDGKVYRIEDVSTLTEIGSHSGGDVYLTVALNKLWVVDGDTPKYYDGTTYGDLNDFLYTTEVVGTSDGSSTSYNYTTKNLPVSPNSVSISYTINGTVYTATDDGKGNITGTDLTGTVAYDTGAVSLTFSTAPDSGTDINITYSSSDVLEVKGDFVEFRQERLWLAKGDTLYFSEIRDPSRWGFIKVASKDESDISAIAQLYDRLIIFKEGKDRGIYALSGNSDADFIVTLITKGVSTKNRAKVDLLGDLYFLDGGQLYSLRTVVEYGDIKPIQINQKFFIREDGNFHIAAIPVANVLFGVESYSGFSFTPTRDAFTSLVFQEEITCLRVIENTVYAGGVNGLYKFDDVGSDNGKEVIYILKPKIINLGGFRRVLIKRLSLYASGIDDATIEVNVFKRDRGYNLTSLVIPKTSRWDEAIWDADKWSNPSLFYHPVRQVVGSEYVYFFFVSKGRTVIDAIAVEVA